MITETHPFEPFLPDGARILFLGSFPPQRHRWCMPFYYPNWINDFWRILGLIFFSNKDHFCIPGEKRFDEARIRDFCTREGLAFYDTACEVRRLKDNASDAFLQVVTPTDIAALLARIPDCHTLVTTGQKATEVLAAWLGCEVPPVGGCIRIEIPDRVGDDGDDATVGDDGDDAAVGDDGDAPASYNVIPGLTGDRTPRYARPDRASHNVMPGVDRASHNVMPGVDRASHTITFWRMPSTSRAYPLPLEKKADAYRRLFQQR